MSTDLKLRNKAQAELKFLCLKLRKSMGARTFENMGVEEWQACCKSVEKIAVIVEENAVDREIVRGYGVKQLADDIKNKATSFVGDLESVMDEIKENDMAKFQVKEKVDFAKRSLGSADRVIKALEKLSTEEKDARKEWEEKNPRLAEQERELMLYSKTLSGLLLKTESLNRLDRGEWIQAEGCLRTLEPFLLEHKIEADRIKHTNFEEILRAILARFESLDKDGIDRKSVDVDRAERVWGLIDKLGSGVAWLTRSHKLLTAGEPVNETCPLRELL
jgi:hypothetical protein